MKRQLLLETGSVSKFNNEIILKALKIMCCKESLLQLKKKPYLILGTRAYENLKSNNNFLNLK